MSDTNYSDLINKFGSASKEEVETPHADLINRYGGGNSDTKFVSPNYKLEAGSLIPQPNDEPPSPPQPQTSLPVEAMKDYGSNFIGDIASGNQSLAQGFNEITQGKPASGVGNIGMGILKTVGAPVTAGLSTLEHGVTQATGNPDIGERASIVAGAGLPIKGLNKAVGARVPTERALNKVVDLIGEENLPQAVQALRENPRLSIMDVSRGVKSAGQGLAVTPGPHQKQLIDFANERSMTAKGAVEDIYNDAMGAPVDVKNKLDTLKTTIKNVGKNEINPIVAAAKPVDLTPVIQNIDNILKPGVQSVITQGEALPSIGLKKELENLKPLLTDGKSVRTSADELHKIQSNLRQQAEGMLDSANGQDRLIGRGLMNVRNGIVDAIDTASGGAYKPALSKYREANQVDEAFNKGFSVTKNRPGQWSDRPEFWQDWVKNASPEELQAAKEGARIAVDQQINGMRFGAKKGTDIPEVEFNRDKLNLLFPKEEVDKMAKGLQHEKMIAESNSDLFKGSQTSFREQGAKAIEPRPDYKPTLTSLLAPMAELATNAIAGIPVAGGAGVIAYQQARKFQTKLGQKLDKATNNRIVDLITAQGESRDALIDALSKRISGPKPSMLQRVQGAALPVLPP